MDSIGHASSHPARHHLVGAGEPSPSRRPPPPLRGRGLRFVLVDELMARPRMTVAELAAALARHGFDVAGRASKIISDALRWEVRRGRVQRLGRGLYRYHRAPTSTARRIRICARACRTWAVAVMRGQAPPPTPPNRRPPHTPWHHRPHDPPWADLAWLWTT